MIKTAFNMMEHLHQIIKKLKKKTKKTERITKIKLYIDKYNWKGINYPSEKDD